MTLLQKRKAIGLLWIIGALVVFSSCDSNRVYDQYVTVPESGWNKDSLAIFSVDILDAEVNYNLYFNVRNKSDYPNSNLWLFIDVMSPSGVVQRDTVDCVLADDSGRWLGSGWGSMFQLSTPYRMNVKFPEKGEYLFRFCHGMRVETLEGIHNIGLRVERVDVGE